MSESELPAAWGTCVLSDLGEINSGGTPSTKNPEFWGDEIPWISPSDLTGYKAKYIARGAKSLSRKGLTKSSAKLLPAGSIHFSSRAPIGYVAISSQSLCTNQGFKSLSPADGVFNEYVYFYLKSIKDLANSLATGTTFKELSGKAFAKLPIPLPPLAEQKRIVSKIEELFSELDAGEESLRRARRQLGVYRQSLLKQAFEGKLTAPWRKQNPHLLESNEQLLARIQAERQARYQQQLKEWEKAGGGRGKPKKPENICLLSDLTLASPPDLPHGWAWLKVADIGRIETGTTPPTNDPANYGGDTPFFKPTDLEQGANVREAREHLSAKGRHAARILPAGTTLVTCIGATIGKTGLASVECATNQQINTISPEACLEPRFVYYAAIAPNLNGLVKSEASATTLPILNKSKFEALPFPICSLPEQREIVRLLDEQFTVIEQNEREIDAALKRSAALRQSILKKAFTGQLVPQDPTDEPASALLERIRKERQSGGAKEPIKKSTREAEPTP